MKPIYIFLLVFSACRPAENGEGPVGVYPVIPVHTLRADDPLLSVENGQRYYRGEPFSGTIETFFASGRIQARQQFFHGKEEGLLETFYESGAKDTRRLFRNGEKDSVHTGWWPDGRLRFEYHFRDGIYNGDFREWYESGQPLKHIVYRDGKEQKGQGWRPNGKPYMSFEMRNGRIYGLINPNLCYSLKNEKGEFVRTIE